VSLLHRGINFVAFQVAWFACVVSAASAVPHYGLLVAAGVVLLHLMLAQRKQAEALLLLSAVSMGLVFDSLLASTGWVRYPSGQWLPGLAPYWILALWAVFATTLNVSMRWLHGRLFLAALLGGVFGPLSYLGGARLGGMAFVQAWPALSTLAIGWALVMPALVALAVRLENVPARSATGAEAEQVAS